MLHDLRDIQIGGGVVVTVARGAARGRAGCAQTADLAWQILQTYNITCFHKLLQAHMFAQGIARVLCILYMTQPRQHDTAPYCRHIAMYGSLYLLLT